MPKPRVAICHQTVIGGDAIGNDIVGMYRLMERLELEPVIVCEAYGLRIEGLRTSKLPATDLSSFALLIYHHSQFWAGGEEMLGKLSCPVIFRYHNITPARFFAPHTERYEAVCAEGRRMTRRLRDYPQPHRWLADSLYNREDLAAVGIDAAEVTVSPPFTRVEQLLRAPRPTPHEGQLDLIFIGRIAPNKGHLHLLRLMDVLVHEQRRPARLRIVGTTDPELHTYNRQIRETIAELDIESNVELVTHCSDAALTRLFQNASFFTCFSEHEGFCVPIIEAQAMGVPVIGADIAAVGETAGAGQYFDALPSGDADYAYYAALIAYLADEPQLRAEMIWQGEKNVRERFTAEPVENVFTGALYDALNLT